MRYLSMLGLVFLLGACAGLGGSTYQGNSTAYGSRTLRNDVMNNIKLFERGTYSCNSIQSVNAQVLDLKEVRGLVQALESWQVQACGQTHTYQVSLRQSSDGGTNIGVTFKKEEE
ncbi:hypothetical protein [Neisseria montereyensis]|uniref:Lipoprotein n=1 Tax=Neisseria montereyensis TaxID=2973938 RepID=A0ABT2F9X4_9NEIS|nr:hypothetical protein [Neisseria montereyensis]MCS4532900.1 hypothetical protein [Neisseria montereyensis]